MHKAKRLTKIKIHCHPRLPPIPSILEMAAASRPEKAPASCDVFSRLQHTIHNVLKLTEIAVKNVAILCEYIRITLRCCDCSQQTLC